MKTSELRKRFLDFFASRKHTVIKSDSLVPKNDPTLLFTGAGMNQFKDYFLGVKTDLKRAASSQKCLRTGDLDEVGKTPYHHSFFEMLGNFSFGDYFKEEAIAWAWEFLTKELSISKDRLFVSVHQNDDEAFNIWAKKIGIPEQLIARLGDKSNFWPADAPKAGPNGPCGPCSEIFYDQGPDYPNATGQFWAEDESGRYAEIWNLVFTQFERQEGGKLIPLKAKNIDTGMGLERLACVMQKKKSNFEIDLFEPIHAEVKRSLGLTERSKLISRNLYAISDHVRAVVFSIADGALPANDGRGYVVRKLIRRALWHAHELLNAGEAGFNRRLERPFLYQAIPAVIGIMKDTYPELGDAEASVRNTVQSEEERFLNTLETGLNILENRMTKMKPKGMLSAEVVFELYDTYGFPDELTKIIAEKSGFKIDEPGFERLLEEQRKRAKASTKIAGAIFTASDVNKELIGLPETKFLGYETLRAEGKIIWSSFTGADGVIALDQTPFYPEGGGQVGDVGTIESQEFAFSVTDTQKEEKVILHYGTLTKGKQKTGEKCTAEVNKVQREATKRNHTATHLLQAALRSIIGMHVRQVGSLVNPEKLRFDFTHGKALSVEEIKQVEDWVNQAIQEASEIQAKKKSYDEAMKSGVLAFFGDKYGTEVRVLEIPGRSKELCGGTHCHQTSEIESFVITSETSIGSGVRRIEAFTGEKAKIYLRDLKETSKTYETLKTEALRLGIKISRVKAETLTQIQSEIQKLQKKIKDFSESNKTSGPVIDPEELIHSATLIGNMKLISRTIPDGGLEVLRGLVDQVRSKAKQGVIVLFSTNRSKVDMVVALTKDLFNSNFDAKAMAQKAAPYLEGSAGGRKDLAQGGGRNEAGIESAVKAISELIQETGE